MSSNAKEYVEMALQNYSSAIARYESAIKKARKVYDNCSDGFDDTAMDNIEIYKGNIKRCEEEIECLTNIKKGLSHLKIAIYSWAQGDKKFSSAKKLFSPLVDNKAYEIAHIKQVIQIYNSAKPYFSKAESSYRNAGDYIGCSFKNPEGLFKHMIAASKGRGEQVDDWIRSAEKRIKELNDAVPLALSGGIKWQSYDKGIAIAKEQGKKIFLCVYVEGKSCTLLKKTTFKDSSVINYLNDNFVSILIDLSVSIKERKLADSLGVSVIPYMRFLTKDNTKIRSLAGYVDAKNLLNVLKSINL